jgi:hypothetical protein
MNLFTYSFICMRDKSVMDLELGRELNYIPKCLKCNGNMTIRFSINNDGEVWMNEAILNSE